MEILLMFLGAIILILLGIIFILFRTLSEKSKIKDDIFDDIFKNRNNPNVTASHANNLPKNLDESVFQTAFNLMEKTNYSLFITGKAGTGKSTLVEYFRINTKKSAVCLAPTGVAALNIRGKTIHSLFKFPPQVITSDAIKNNTYREEVRELFENVDTILIDEISMVRADLIQGVDYILKKFRKDDRPFGGVQMIFVGDMYQLPPVVGKDKLTITHKDKNVYEGYTIDYFFKKYKGPYFFNSDAFKECEFKYYELNTVFRQKDDNEFINLLNSIRENNINEEILSELNKQHIEAMSNSDNNRIELCSNRSLVERKNGNMMKILKSPAFNYEAAVSGIFTDVVKEKDYPAKKDLTLKQGAQVMMLINDKEGRWVNGTIGIISKLSNDEIVVEINDTPYTINKYTWEAVDYKYDKEQDKLITTVIGSYTQYPLMLAWAITIHKSQGKTFEKVTIDLGYNGAFEHGQTYVALSRCKTLSGISLKRPINRKDIIVADEVVKFIKEMNSKF